MLFRVLKLAVPEDYHHKRWIRRKVDKWRKVSGKIRWLTIGQYRCTDEACRLLRSAFPDGRSTKIEVLRMEKVFLCTVNQLVFCTLF